MAAHTTVQEVLAALGDVDFPAGKDDLLAAARAAGASEEVQKALRGIPPDEYANRDEVARSVRLDPADEQGLDAAQRAEQARHGGRQGLGQGEVDVREPVIEEELQRPTGRFGGA
jgi:hypothetical protein